MVKETEGKGRTKPRNSMAAKKTNEEANREGAYHHDQETERIDSRGDVAGGLYGPRILPTAVDHDDDYHYLSARNSASDGWDVSVNVFVKASHRGRSD